MFFKTKKIRFAIVEDDSLYSYMLSYSIDEVYQAYIETYNSVEALLKQNDSNPNVILLDHFLSGIKGIDALEIIRNKFPNSHIVIISSQKDLELISTVVNTHHCSYIQKKDFSISNFTTIIDKLLN